MSSPSPQGIPSPHRRLRAVLDGLAALVGAGLLGALAGCGPIRLPVSELVATESSGSESSCGEMESDSSSDTAPTSSTTGPDPFCGDGIVNQDSEECDAGDANADNAACTSECKQAVCGDGLTHEGVEECDDGDNNADNAACTEGCTIAICGDGLVHEGTEQCDEGQDTGDCINCEFHPSVFISSNSYNGDLGGLDGADQKCQALATAAGLPGTYKAWLSNSTTSAADRLGIQNFTGDLRLTDKNLVATGWAGLISDNLQNPINIDETGGSQDEQDVWSHTTQDGSLKGNGAHCMNWTSSDQDATGRSGRSSDLSSGWTDYLTFSCDYTNHLYCIQTAP